MAGTGRFPSQDDLNKINPNEPRIPPTLTSTSDAEEIIKFLKMLVFSLQSEENDWHLDILPIGFPTLESWVTCKSGSFFGARFLTFSEWIGREVQSTSNKSLLGLFCTWSGDWANCTANETWERSSWRSWGAVLRNFPASDVNELILWDPWFKSAYEKENSERTGGNYPKGNLLQGQRDLIDILSKRKGGLTRAWIGGEGIRERDPVGLRETSGFFLDTLTGPNMQLPRTEKGFRRWGYFRVMLEEEDADDASVKLEEEEDNDVHIEERDALMEAEQEMVEEEDDDVQIVVRLKEVDVQIKDEPEIEQFRYWKHAELWALPQEETKDTSPRFKHMPDPNELSNASRYEDLYLHLWFLRASLEYHHDGTKGIAVLTEDGLASPWRLHHYPIGFSDKVEKTKWKKNNIGNFRCFSQFLAQKLDRDVSIRLALFCSKSEEWAGLGDTELDEKPYDAWVGILEPCGYDGARKVFRLLIYDCNVKSDSEKAIKSIGYHALSAMQIAFVKFLTEEKVITDVWLLGSENGNPDRRCLPLTSAWLCWFLLQWRQWPWDAKYLRDELGAVRVRFDQDGDADHSASSESSDSGTPLVSSRRQVPHMQRAPRGGQSGTQSRSRSTSCGKPSGVRKTVARKPMKLSQRALEALHDAEFVASSSEDEDTMDDVEDDATLALWDKAAGQQLLREATA